MRVRLDLLRGMPSLLIVGNVVDGDAVRRGWVALRDGLIAGVGEGSAPGGFGGPVELGDLLITPGSSTCMFTAATAAKRPATTPRRSPIRCCGRPSHASHGTTCLVATTVSDTADRLRAAAAGVRIAMDAGARDGAVVAGVHLEGPWLAPRRHGAHDPATLRLPDPAELLELIDAAGGAIRMLTLAPELDGAGPVIAAARARGIVVSVVTRTPPMRRPAPRSTPALVI